MVHNRCNIQVKKLTQHIGRSPIGEVHHGLPEQYSKWFESRTYSKNKVKLGQTIDINSGEFYYDLPKELHRLKSGHGIHTNSSYAGKTWNKAWGEYIKAYPNATAEETLAHLRQMERDFGIVKYKARQGK